MSFRKTISYVLFPLTMWYPITVWLRNLLFDMGVKRQVVPPVTTIGVGNLCVGGAGKTPMADYLLSLLEGQYHTALLSRGYRRKTVGYVTDDGKHRASQLGDEPAMLAYKHPQVQVAVCENRVAGVQRLLENSDKTKKPSTQPQTPQVVVLDDVFQHRAIKPTVNILLTEYDKPYFTDHVMPYGNLREGRRGRLRAGIVIVTKSPEKLDPITRHNYVQRLKLGPHQKVFFCHVQYVDPLPLMGKTPLPLNTLDSCLVLTGIAHPEPMLEYVRQQCPKVTHLRYADHHRYTEADLAHIRKTFEQLEGHRKLILTTEKDAARLREMAASEALTGLPIYYLPIKMCIHPGKEYDFDQALLTNIKENVLFLNQMQNSPLTLRT